MLPRDPEDFDLLENPLGQESRVLAIVRYNNES